MHSYLSYDSRGKYLGGVAVAQQAIEAAKMRAQSTGEPVDVVKVGGIEGSRRVRYHPDGRVEKLWKNEK